MNKLMWIVRLFIIVFLGLLAGCKGSLSATNVQSTPPTATATILIQPTQTPQPTATSRATDTAQPTETLQSTATSKPTAITQPTKTSKPTQTKIPTSIPTPLASLTPYPISQLVDAHGTSMDAGERRRYIPATLKEFLPFLASASEENQIIINYGGDFYRIAVTYTGAFRDIPSESQQTIYAWLALDDPQQYESIKAEDLFTVEGRFIEDGIEYWLPVQKTLLSAMKTETKENDEIYLYVIEMGTYTSSKKQAHPVFAVANFLTPKKKSEAAIKIPMFCPTENDEAMNAFNQAAEMKDHEKFTEAENLYLNAINLDPNFCDAMDNLGVLLRKQGRIDEAIQWYQRSLEIKPDNRLALRNMGIAYRYLKNWDKSDQAFENLIQIAPDDPEGYFGLGINHFINDEYEKAANALEAAELLYLQSGSPYVVDAQYYLGASYYYLQDFARARGYLAPIYDLQPDDLFINLSLGISNLLLEPKDLELVKIYLLKAEALGYTLPDSLVQTLVKEFGAWPPK